MPCEMDNQPGGVRLYISADDSEMDNQAGGEIQYLEAWHPTVTRKVGAAGFT